MGLLCLGWVFYVLVVLSGSVVSWLIIGCFKVGLGLLCPGWVCTVLKWVCCVLVGSVRVQSWYDGSWLGF